MTQLTDDRDLALEAIDGGAGGGRLGHDQLEGDHLAGEVVARLIDHAHRTTAQLAQRRVIGNGLGQPRGLGTAERAPPLDLLAGRPGLRAHDRQIRRCHRPTARAPNLAHRDRLGGWVHLRFPVPGRQSLPQLDLDPEDALSRRDHVTRDQPHPIHSIVVHKRTVRAAQIA